MLADAPSYDYSNNDAEQTSATKEVQKPITKKGLALFKDQNDAKVKEFILKNSK